MVRFRSRASRAGTGIRTVASKCEIVQTAVSTGQGMSERGMNLKPIRRLAVALAAQVSVLRWRRSWRHPTARAPLASPPPCGPHHRQPGRHHGRPRPAAHLRQPPAVTVPERDQHAQQGHEHASGRSPAPWARSRPPSQNVTRTVQQVVKRRPRRWLPGGTTTLPVGGGEHDHAAAVAAAPPVQPRCASSAPILDTVHRTVTNLTGRRRSPLSPVTGRRLRLGQRLRQRGHQRRRAPTHSASGLGSLAGGGGGGGGSARRGRRRRGGGPARCPSRARSPRRPVLAACRRRPQRRGRQRLVGRRRQAPLLHQPHHPQPHQGHPGLVEAASGGARAS